MAPTPLPSLSAALTSSNDVQYAFEHVFLPPQLPQSQEDPQTAAQLDLKLIDGAHRALRAFRNYYPDHKATLNSAIGGLQALYQTLNSEDGGISEESLLDALDGLTSGVLAAIPLHVRAQNAGVIIARAEGGLSFEAFELSATNEAVNGSVGRLVRHFPGCAVFVPDAECTAKEFQSMLAYTLSRMSIQPAPGQQPKAAKAGTLHDEERTTTHPGAVTELLMSVLRGIGRPFAVSRIEKNTRDEVLWKDCLLPWRRSPVWMLVRTFLQLSFTRADIGNGSTIYKGFITFYSACILDRALALDLLDPLPKLFVMSAKITRRLQKLDTTLASLLRDDIAAVLGRVRGSIKSDWRSIQSNHNHVLDLSSLRSLDVNMDTFIPLPELNAHLEALETGRAADRSNQHTSQRTSLRPPDLTVGYLQYSSDSIPPAGFLSDAGQYTITSLVRFENWASAHLSQCLDNYDVDHACRLVYRLICEYYNAASKAYLGNAEALSFMVLTVFELWIACDKRATRHYPQLGEYNVPIPLRCLQSLLLPMRSQMDRLRTVELYFTARERGVRHEGKHLFGDPIGGDASKSFAVQYFDDSPDRAEMHGRFADIQRVSKETEEETVKELGRKKQSRKELEQKAAALKCKYKDRIVSVGGREKRDSVHDDDNCEKCPLLRRAESITIQVFEALLPKDPHEAKAIVFELRIPVWYSFWRDCTVTLLADVLRASYLSVHVQPPQEKFRLSGDERLREWYKYVDRRIVLNSIKKGQRHAHYLKVRKVVTDGLLESEVCVANGLQYHYVDQVRNQFLGGFSLHDALAQQCTYQVPGRSSGLRKFLTKPSGKDHREDPNVVIAGLSDRPVHFKSDEYTELCTLPQGFETMWHELALQLHVPGIDFGKEETVMLVLQCINQSGPPAEGVYRVAHSTPTSSGFSTQVLRDLQASLAKIGDNWESANALAIFAAIASRILTLSASIEVQRLCKTFLATVCDVAFRWVIVLRERSHSAPDARDRKDARLRAMEVALVCVSCFDVDDRHLSEMLEQQHRVARLVQCSMILAQRSYNPTNPLAAVLLMRSKRLLQRSYELVASSHGGLDSAVGSMWSQYHPGSDAWTRLPGDLFHWITKDTTSPTGHEMTVHYDLLSGKFLVNGTKLLQTPTHYQHDPLFRSLFGELDVEVMPSNVGGMSYMITRSWKGFEVHLGWSARNKELLVLAFKNGYEHEVIPSRLLHLQVPSSFEKSFVHWLHKSSGTIMFSSVHDPWNFSSAETWQLFRHGQAWTLRNGNKNLLGSNSTSSRVISQILAPLVDAADMHVYLLDPISGRVEVDLPAIQMAFTLVKSAGALRSKQFPDMTIDYNQTVPTLCGLFNKLLLRSETTGIRRLLVPEGQVHYEQYSSHISVTIDKATITKVHALVVNERIGCLEDNGSLQCKLFMAYLHALTSFCLPDPLTKKTGTEQALSILRSAATRSLVQQLTPANTEMLCKIAHLAPGRAFYPNKESKPMQTVAWDSNLGFLSQDGAFYIAARSLMQQAEDSSMFYPQGEHRLPSIDHVEESLVKRDLMKSSTVKRGAEAHPQLAKEHDRVYTHARDNNHESDRSFRAFGISRIISTKDGRPHWQAPSPNYLTDIAEKMLLICGPDSQLEEGIMKYDASLFQSTPQSVLQHLPVLHSHFLGGKVDQYALIIWLGSIAFAKEKDLPMIQLIALCFTAAPIRAIRPPKAETFDLSVGVPNNTGSNIKEALVRLVRDAAKPFSKTPAAKRDASEGECRRIYDQKVTAASANFIRNCAAWWREGVIKVPKLGEHEPYLNGDEAAKIVQDKFQLFRDNSKLYEYFNKLQVAAHGLPANILELDHSPLGVPRYRANPCPGVASVDDLFSGPAPLLLDPPYLNRSQFEVDSDENGPSMFTTTGFELRRLVDHMTTDASQYQREYLNGLRESKNSLNDMVTGGTTLVASQEILLRFLSSCREYTNYTFAAIKSASSQAIVNAASGKGDGSGRDDETGMHVPQVSPVLLLQQLSRHRWCKLNDEWKACIVAYGLALSREQRADRLLKVSGNQDEFAKELDNIGHENWNPFEFPESLLLEVESGILIRKVQEQIASKMRNPPNELNSMMQLNMGEGKSSTIVPIVAAALADGQKLVRIIVAKPQSAQMAQMLISKLGGLLDRRIFYMPFSRQIKLSPARAEAVLRLNRQCMVEGGIMLMQPEQILSFQLMGPECLVSGRENSLEVGRKVLETLDFLDKSSRDIVDESDENFDCRFELIYTMGLQRPVEMKPQRWLYIQEVLSLVQKYCTELATQSPTWFEIDEHGAGGFARIRILDPDAGQLVTDKVAAHIAFHGLRGFPAARTEGDRSAVFEYIGKYEVTAENTMALKSGSLWKQHQTTLLLLRGMLACRLLSFAFEQKRWRVNYGLADRTPETKLAVPYRAKDSPSLRAEFSHPDVVIVFTCLSYYYGGLEDKHLFLALGHLMNSDQKDMEYVEWVRNTDMPKAFRHLSGVNLKDSPTCISRVFPHLRLVKAAIDYFLSHIVFESGMREFPWKMSASGWDLGKKKSHPTTGFSGTVDSKDLLPLDVTQLDLAEQRHTNALVLDHLLSSMNSVAPMLPSHSANTQSDAERLLDLILQQKAMIHVVLDVGAQILELGNEEFARLWLQLETRGGKEAAIFCNDADELTVIDRLGNVESLQTSSFATRMDVCLVYLDEAHTRGIDLKLPTHYRAAVTLGADLTKDRLVQACMRMRKLGQGQTVVFVVPDEIRNKIEHLGLVDVLKYTIQGTFAAVERGISNWVTQGHRFAVQEGLWNKLGTGEKASLALKPQLALEFREPEARTISHRYSPGREFDVQLAKLCDETHLAKVDKNVGEMLKKIKAHSEAFGNPPRGARRMMEEQERELSPELEETRHDERPVPASAATHNLSPDLLKYILTGRRVADSGAIRPAFDTLNEISIAKKFDFSRLGRNLSERLEATADFARTVKKVKDVEHISDAFLRPVQWILTIRQPKDTVVGVAILISPWEARVLKKHVQVSQFAALHLYKPRINRTHTSLDKLDFLTIRQGSGDLKISSQLITQLNIFAGQLYFSSYNEYIGVCNFLGLTYRHAAPAWEVDADHFIRKDSEGRVGGLSGLSKSPVEFLKIFYSKIRRHGEDCTKTHMGRLLGGEFLTEADFAAAADEDDGH